MVDIYVHLSQLMEKGQEGILVTVVEKEGSGPLPPGAKMLFYADGRTAGTVGGGTLEQIAIAKSAELIREKQSLLQRYALVDHNHVAEEDESTGMVCGGNVTLFYEYVTSGPHLYLFGGGHVGQALVYHLRDLPYHVTVIDERPGVEETMGDVARVLIRDYEKALENEAVPMDSFFVVATPSHKADYLVLKTIFTSHWKPRYVGLLSSRTKAAKFVRDLDADLGSDADFSALYTPVGLDIGGSSAHEIALAVLAEIQALRYGRSDVRHLKTS
jgi:xanthine dehydrogenase accessory factor